MQTLHVLQVLHDIKCLCQLKLQRRKEREKKKWKKKVTIYQDINTSCLFLEDNQSLLLPVISLRSVFMMNSSLQLLRHPQLWTTAWSTIVSLNLLTITVIINVLRDLTKFHCRHSYAHGIYTHIASLSQWSHSPDSLSLWINTEFGVRYSGFWFGYLPSKTLYSANKSIAFYWWDVDN